MQLMLILFLLLLPGNHLVFLLFRVQVDVVLQGSPLSLNVFDLRVKLALYLQHLLLNDYLNVLLGQTLFYYRVISMATFSHDFTIFFPIKRLLKVNFELKAFSHSFIYFDNMLENRPSAYVCQNLLLHLNMETICNFVEFPQLIFIKKWAQQFLNDFECTQWQVSFDIILQR